MQPEQIKKIAHEIGADLCGIASVDRFSKAPAGYHPGDVLSGCQTVVVIAKRFLHSTLLAESTIPYTTVRNTLVTRMNELAVQLSERLEAEGLTAIPMNPSGPDEFDASTNKFRGIISLKHAAVAAGLGKIGKNTLLVNKEFGNMLWFSGAFVREAVAPDPIADYTGCRSDCRLCLDSCPVGALDGVSIDQGACKAHAFGEHNGGEYRIKCFTCRKVCPNRFGVED